MTDTTWASDHSDHRSLSAYYVFLGGSLIVWKTKKLTRVNSTNVLDEGLRIGGIGRRMNSKVKISQTRCVSKISVVLNLAQSQSVPGRPLLAPIYRWPSLKDPVGFNTNYNVRIRYQLVFQLCLWLGLS
jgi:hypothetical protein